MVRPARPLIDRHLVARAQSSASAAHVHELSGLLGLYFGVAEMQQEGLMPPERVVAIEQQLRAFCLRQELARLSDAEWCRS